MSLPEQSSSLRARQSSIRIWILIITCLTVFACIGVWAFFLNSPFSPLAGAFTNGCFPYQPERIQNFARFTLPPSATNLESFCAGLQGWVATAKFEMLPKDMDELIKNTLLQTPLSSTVEAEKFGVFLRELLDDHQPGSYLYGKAELSPEFIQEVLIETTNPIRYIVVMAG